MSVAQYQVSDCRTQIVGGVSIAEFLGGRSYESEEVFGEARG
jgi:hypothetical protein